MTTPDGGQAAPSLSPRSSPERHGPPTDQPTDDRIAELLAENRDLRAKVERADQILASATDQAVITMNLGGRITGWNAGARAILGYAEADILGRSGELLFTPEDRADGVFVGELCRAMEAGRAPNERLHLRNDGGRFWASGAMLPLLDGGGGVVGFLNVFRDDTAARAEEERRTSLLTEAGHRVRNILATVQAVARQTLRDGVPREVLETLTDRLFALARSHEAMTGDARDGAPLSEVAGRMLLPYGGSGRVRLEGPPVRLPARAAELLGLVFHELATNAAKYGALSIPEGRVDLGWQLRCVGGGTRLVEILWREDDGPPVVPPATRGFGSRLPEQGVVHDLGGTVRLDFRPSGLECRIGLPLASGPDDDPPFPHDAASEG